MNHFEYIEDKVIKVKLDGKHVGNIKCLPDKKWAYFPKGSNAHGEAFMTVEAVKRSLEEE